MKVGISELHLSLLTSTAYHDYRRENKGETLSVFFNDNTPQTPTGEQSAVAPPGSVPEHRLDSNMVTGE